MTQASEAFVANIKKLELIKRNKTLLSEKEKNPTESGVYEVLTDATITPTYRYYDAAKDIWGPVSESQRKAFQDKELNTVLPFYPWLNIKEQND
jgi:hypothetical protein